MAMLFCQYGCYQGNDMFGAANEKTTHIAFCPSTTYHTIVKQEISSFPMQQTLTWGKNNKSEFTASEE